jgi:hypothetical protein
MIIVKDEENCWQLSSLFVDNVHERTNERMMGILNPLGDDGYQKPTMFNYLKT